MNIIKRLDLFSVPVSFSFQGRRYAGSFVGTFFTVSLIAFILFIGIYVSSELWRRESPQLNISTYISQEKIYLKDYPLVFGVYNQENRPVMNFENYLTISPVILSTSNNGTVSVKPRRTIPCLQKLSDFSLEGQQSMQNMAETNSFYCIDFEQDDYISGEVSNLNSQQIVFYYRACVNYPNCKPMDQIKDYLKGYQIILLQGNTVINGIDKNNPVQNTALISVLTLSFSLYKQNRITLQKQKVKSNDGIFKDNWTYFQGYANLQTSYDYSDIYSKSKDGSTLGTIVIGLSNQIQLTTRQYLMFSEVLAKTMGYYGALYGILAFLLQFYQQYVLQLDFHQTLLNLGYEIQENELQELEIIKVSDLTRSGNNPSISLDKRNKILGYMQEYNFINVMKLRVQGICKKKDISKGELNQSSFYSKVDQLVQKLLSLEGLFMYILPKEIIDQKYFQSMCQIDSRAQNKQSEVLGSFEEFNDQIIQSPKTEKNPNPNPNKKIAIKIQSQKI